MKKLNSLYKGLITVSLVTSNLFVLAQRHPLQFFRPNNQRGLSVFETGKNDSTTFDGMKVRIGGNFTQDFQALNHSNSAAEVVVNGANINQLVKLKNGFNLATANLNVDAQLEDGIRLNLIMYLSSRHHSETWVKGGYLQVDRLEFFNSKVIDKIMEHITIKAGAYEIDYGDQHFRRTDGGNAIYNPFIENYILDEFATEIGGEVYFHTQSGFFAMAGITNGQLNPTVLAPSKIDSATGNLNYYTPAFHGKLGWDKQVTNDLRLRATGSVYAVKSAAGNTLFNGDRTGSHYFFVMENTGASASANAFSGRFNPRFSQQVTAFMFNPFIKFKGLELFGTYEIAQGRLITEKKMRTATQLAVDLIYRFPKRTEKFWVGTRYNALTTALPGLQQNVTIERLAGSIGWFVTKNIVLKAEYVKQQYYKFAPTDILSQGKFNGFLLQASIGF